MRFQEIGGDSRRYEGFPATYSVNHQRRQLNVAEGAQVVKPAIPGNELWLLRLTGLKGQSEPYCQFPRLQSGRVTQRNIIQSLKRKKSYHMLQHR